jgi:hypothetical protein
MPIVEPLKYDIRVRERLLRKGLLNESEVKVHLDSLSDLGDRAVEIELKQPALQKESERAEYARISRPSPSLARPAPIRPFDEEDEDDELSAPPVDEDDDLDDEDDDDDEEDDEAGDEGAGAAGGEAANGEAKKGPADEDDWGTGP